MIQPMTHWSISSEVLKDEAEKMGFAVKILSAEKNFFMVNNGIKSVYFKSTDFGGNSALGKKIADDKALTYMFCEQNDFPIAKTRYVTKQMISDF